MVKRLLQNFFFARAKGQRTEGISLQAGVTLIEMIVVVGIIALVSSIMIFNYSDFSSNVSIRNLTQEVALSIRKAQTYATSVRPIEGLIGVNSRVFGTYGISFSLDDNTIGNLPDPKQFVLFADIPDVSGVSDGIYSQAIDDCGNPSTSDIECIETFGITTSDRVTEFCTQFANSATEQCVSSGSVDITYSRPNPDAKIYYRSVPGATPELWSHVKIVFISAKGLTRSVAVWNTGQISVQ